MCSLVGGGGCVCMEEEEDVYVWRRRRMCALGQNVFSCRSQCVLL